MHMQGLHLHLSGSNTEVEILVDVYYVSDWTPRLRTITRTSSSQHRNSAPHPPTLFTFPVQMPSFPRPPASKRTPFSRRAVHPRFLHTQ